MRWSGTVHNMKEWGLFWYIQRKVDYSATKFRKFICDSRHITTFVYLDATLHPLCSYCVLCYIKNEINHKHSIYIYIYIYIVVRYLSHWHTVYGVCVRPNSWLNYSCPSDEFLRTFTSFGRNTLKVSGLMLNSCKRLGALLSMCSTVN
jgi:hypothetical protein